jgi:hypothetical protein
MVLAYIDKETPFTFIRNQFSNHSKYAGESIYRYQKFGYVGLIKEILPTKLPR